MSFNEHFTILHFDRYASCHRHKLPLGRKIWLEDTVAAERIRPVRGPLFLIGSTTDCDLVPDDRHFQSIMPTFSYKAAIVSAQVWPTAAPELQVAGEAVETAELLDGNLLSFGPFELRLHVDEDMIVHELPAVVPTVLTTA